MLNLYLLLTHKHKAHIHTKKTHTHFSDYSNIPAFIHTHTQKYTRRVEWCRMTWVRWCPVIRAPRSGHSSVHQRSGAAACLGSGGAAWLGSDGAPCLGSGGATCLGLGSAPWLGCPLNRARGRDILPCTNAAPSDPRHRAPPDLSHASTPDPRHAAAPDL